eukprot:701179-Amphidinium_carterae.1
MSEQWPRKRKRGPVQWTRYPLCQYGNTLSLVNNGEVILRQLDVWLCSQSPGKDTRCTPPIADKARVHVAFVARVCA